MTFIIMKITLSFGVQFTESKSYCLSQKETVNWTENKIVWAKLGQAWWPGKVWTGYVSEKRLFY